CQAPRLPAERSPPLPPSPARAGQPVASRDANTLRVVLLQYRQHVRTESLGTAYLVVPDGPGPHPGVVVIHELYRLTDNIPGRCADQGCAAVGVHLFDGRMKAICMLRMLTSVVTGNLNDAAVGDLKAALRLFSQRPDVDPRRIGAVGFCMGGFYATTWACTD